MHTAQETTYKTTPLERQRFDTVNRKGFNRLVEPANRSYLGVDGRGRQSSEAAVRGCQPGG